MEKIEVQRLIIPECLRKRESRFPEVPECLKSRLNNENRTLIPECLKSRVTDILSTPKTSTMGRPCIHKKFPTLTSVVCDFVTDHGFAAHERRRETVGSVGVSLQQIQHHCIEKVPGLKAHGISLNTIHRLFNAPNLRTSAQKLYKNIIPARVATKANCVSRGHVDSHYCRSQVSHTLQYVAHFDDEVIGMSADVKAKLNLSGAAVSRMVKANTFMLTSDTINLPDHDFPEPGYKLTPMGYMRLSGKGEHRRRSASPVRTTPRQQATFRDDVHVSREQKTHRTGPLHLFLRAHMYDKETASSHANDLMKVLQPIVDEEKKKAVILFVDNGPDWNKTSLKTMLAMGSVWEKLCLDYMLLTSYAPGDSKYNPIEHAWAPITMWLSGLVLDWRNSMPEPAVRPHRQR